jgi:hypothetical protein
VPDVTVTVDKRDEVAQAVVVHPDDGQATTLGMNVAGKILVEPQMNTDEHR